MKKYKSLLLLPSALFLFSAIMLTACSEEDDTVDEYPDWQVTNEAYYENLSDSVISLIEADEDCGWLRIKNWSFPVVEDGMEGSNTDYIIVEILESAPETETESPIYTDSVKVHYLGRLLPSVSYSNGYIFDYSYYPPFDEETAVASKFVVSGLIDGYATAMMNMKVGDHWKVYIPHQLAYGESGSSSIPAYSTLIFDIRLVDFWAVDD